MSRKKKTQHWAWQQLAIAAQCRYGQDSVLWAIIGSFLSTNSVLLVALFATGSLPRDQMPIRIICAAGAGVSFIWLIMQAAALRRVVSFEHIIRALEGDNNLSLDSSVKLLADPEDSEAPSDASRLLPKARTIMPWIPPVALGAWSLGLLLSLLQLLCNR